MSNPHVQWTAGADKRKDIIELENIIAARFYAKYVEVQISSN